MQNKLMILSNCTVCGKKKSTLIKNRKFHNFNNMTKFIDKSLLTGDKLMPEMHLKHPGFTYSACGTFSKHPSKHLLVFKTS